MSEYPRSAGKRKYFSNRFTRELKSFTNNDTRLMSKMQVFFDSLDAGSVRADPMRFKSKNAKRDCRGFKVYKARAYSEGNVSYRVVFSIMKNSILFVQLHSKSRTDEENHDEDPICKSLKRVKNRDCQDEFCSLEKPLIRAVLKEEHH